MRVMPYWNVLTIHKPISGPSHVLLYSPKPIPQSLKTSFFNILYSVSLCNWHLYVFGIIT